MFCVISPLPSPPSPQAGREKHNVQIYVLVYTIQKYILSKHIAFVESSRRFGTPDKTWKNGKTEELLKQF